MVYGNKFLWESLISRSCGVWLKKIIRINKKQSQEKQKLEQMQKTTSVQLDENIEELVNEKIESIIFLVMSALKNTNHRYLF